MKTLKLIVSGLLVISSAAVMSQTKDGKKDVADNKSGQKKSTSNTSHELKTSPGVSDSVRKATSTKSADTSQSKKDVMKKAEPNKTIGNKKITGYPGNSPKPEKPAGKKDSVQ